MSQRAALTNEAVDRIIDQYEAGQYCTCLIDHEANKTRLFKEVPHYSNCIGKIIISELLYEAKWQNMILKK